MSETPELDRLQSWLLAVITDPRGVSAGVGGDAAQRELPITTHELEQVVARSRQCSSAERLAVYSQAYFARLMECLAAEFDVLAKAAGADAFAALCAGYLQTHPPTSYTLGRLGERFPVYLAQTRPLRESAVPDWADLLIDLARLERVYAEVFDGPGEEGDDPWNVDQLRQIPPREGEALQLRTTASLRLLTFEFPVHEYFAALRQSAAAAPPPPHAVTLAVHRRGYVVQRRELAPEQATLLTALQSGLSLGEALERTASQHRLDGAGVATQLTRWFHDWTAAGILCGVTAPAAIAASAAAPPQSPSRP